MGVPDTASDRGEQYQGDSGADQFAYVHGREMMTSSDDDIKTVRPLVGRDAVSRSFTGINGVPAFAAVIAFLAP